MKISTRRIVFGALAAFPLTIAMACGGMDDAEDALPLDGEGDSSEVSATGGMGGSGATGGSGANAAGGSSETEDLEADAGGIGGSGGLGGAGGTNQQTPEVLLYAPGACGDCAASACYSEALVCESDPDCQDYFNCVRTAASSDCRLENETSWHYRHRASQLATCILERCAPECAGPKAPPDGITYRGVGDACDMNMQCSTNFCSRAHYCTRVCESDDDCSVFPAFPGLELPVGVCVQTNRDDTRLCYRACSTTADCADISTGQHQCRDVGNGVMACTPKNDKKTPPYCYHQVSGGGGCTKDADCECGAKCISTGGTLRSCQIPCKTNADCFNASGGMYNMCFGSSFCG